MRISCPICGDRDRREFYYMGAALQRPDPNAGDKAWADYVHLRENPAGQLDELWSHDAGCGAWLTVTRDTVTHDIKSVRLTKEAVAS